MTATTREILASVRIRIVEPEEAAFWEYVKETEAADAAAAAKQAQDDEDMLWAYNQWNDVD